jgi:hypothetical protein
MGATACYEDKEWVPLFYVIFFIFLIVYIELHQQHSLRAFTDRIFFFGLKCVDHSFNYVAHFCIFERCLNSHPVCFNSKQARYQLSHPSPYLATYLPNFATQLLDLATHLSHLAIHLPVRICSYCIYKFSFKMIL